MRPSGTSEEVTTVGPLGISRLDLEQVSTLVRNVDFLVPHLEFLYGLLEQLCPSSWQLADKGAHVWRMGALQFSHWLVGTLGALSPSLAGVAAGVVRIPTSL